MTELLNKIATVDLSKFEAFIYLGAAALIAFLISDDQIRNTALNLAAGAALTRVRTHTKG